MRREKERNWWILVTRQNELEIHLDSKGVYLSLIQNLNKLPLFCMMRRIFKPLLWTLLLQKVNCEKKKASAQNSSWESKLLFTRTPTIYVLSLTF